MASSAETLPEELHRQLRPKYPGMRVLLQAFVDDPREDLAIDDVLVGVYHLLSPKVPRRSTVTQALYHAVQSGHLVRSGRGRYAIKPSGREWLANLIGN